MEPNQLQTEPERLTSTADIKVGMILRCHHRVHKGGPVLVRVTGIRTSVSRPADICLYDVLPGQNRGGDKWVGGGSTIENFSLVDPLAGDAVVYCGSDKSLHGTQGVVMREAVPCLGADITWDTSTNPFGKCPLSSGIARSAFYLTGTSRFDPPAKSTTTIKFGKLYTISKPGHEDDGRTARVTVCYGDPLPRFIMVPQAGPMLKMPLVYAKDLRETSQGGGLVQPHPVPQFVSDLKLYDLVRHTGTFLGGQEGPVLSLPSSPDGIFDVLLKGSVCKCRRSEVTRIGPLDPRVVQLIEYVKEGPPMVADKYYCAGWNACLKEVERRRDLIGGAAQKAREEVGGPLPGKMSE